MKWIQEAGVVKNFKKKLEESEISREEESTKWFELNDKISQIKKMPSNTKVERKTKDHAVFKLQLELEKDGINEGVQNLALIAEEEEEDT
jgi:hypothetical protein